MAEPNLPIPSRAEDVTSQWLGHVLQDQMADDGVDKVEVTKLTSLGSGEIGKLSSVFRAEFRVTRKETEAEAKEEGTFIKIMPQSEIHRRLVERCKVDVTEIGTYQRLLKDLSEFELKQTGKTGKIAPDLYAAGYDLNPNNRAFFVALKDLTPTHEMADFNSGLTFEQTSHALKALAHYHALAFSYKKVMEVDFNEKYDFFSHAFEDFGKDEGLRDFIQTNLSQVVSDLRSSPGHAHLAEHVERIKPDAYQRFQNIVTLSVDGDGDGDDDGWNGDKAKLETNYLIHGDIWSNNVLFRRKESTGDADANSVDEDAAEACSIVDWQFTECGNVFLDFGTLAFLSMPADQTAARLEDLISLYHGHFVSTCLGLGVKQGQLPWGGGDRGHFGRKAKKFGLGAAFLWASTSYELVQDYPGMKERFFWILAQSVETAPQLYEKAAG